MTTTGRQGGGQTIGWPAAARPRVQGGEDAVEAFGECTGITFFDRPQLSSRAAGAHEIKSAMCVVGAVSRLVEADLSEKSRERMARLHAALGRLGQLVSEDLGEEDGTACFAPSLRLSSVTAIIERATHRVADRAAEARVELFVRCGGGELHCDERALVEAVVNLVSNAIDATAAGGGVVVGTYETDCGGQYWVIQDAGGGIPASQLAELGRPFRSTKAGGSGLGFAVARMAVAAHGGLVRIDSREGAGTIVSVWASLLP